MSNSYVTREALVDFMRDILRDPCTLRLYGNELGPDPTANDFVEPEGGGYSGKPMRAQSWDLTNAPVEANYPKQTFTFTGPAGVVRGWYVTRNSDGRLRWYEPLANGPVRIVNDGDQVSVSVGFALATEPGEEAGEQINPQGE